MGNVNVRVTLNEKDYENYNIFFNKKKIITSMFLFPVLFILCLLILDINDGFDINKFAETLKIGIPVMICVALAILFVQLMLIKVKSKSVFKSNQLLKKEVAYEFNNNGVSSSSEIGSGNIKWSDIFKVVEDKKMFYLFISKNQSMLIPKHCFGDESEIKRLREIIVENVDEKRSKIKS